MEPIKYTINLDYAKLNEHPLGAEEFRETFETTMNILKETGWLVENTKTQEGSTMTCWCSKDTINKEVDLELQKSLENYRGVRGIIFHKLCSWLGEDFKKSATVTLRKQLTEKITNEIIKGCDAELLPLSRINGFSILKGTETLQDVEMPITVNKPKM
jgi:hypothetical protein